ncbi:flagellar protein FlaG [Clostridiaceae bacterium 35-E11]
MKIEGSSAVQMQTQLANQYQGQMKEVAGESLNTDLGQNQAKRENFPGEEKFIEMIEKSNKDLQMDNTSLKFSVHEKTKQILVKIVDNHTQEVIREIPSEKILDMVASMLERTGVFVDKKA